MLIQILMGQIMLIAPVRGAGIREALAQGARATRSNPNITETKRFGAVKTLAWNMHQGLAGVDQASDLT